MASAAWPPASDSPNTVPSLMSTVWPRTFSVLPARSLAATGPTISLAKTMLFAVLAGLPLPSTPIAEPRTSIVMPRRRSSRLRGTPLPSRTVALRSS